MTTAPNLPVRRALTLDGEAIVTLERRYVSNPHGPSLAASAVLTFAAGAGTFWSIWHGYEHVGLAFVVLLAMVGVTAACLNRFNTAGTGVIR